MKRKRTLDERRRTLLRAAKTSAENKHGMGGLEKTHKKPAAITLPKLKFLEDKDTNQ